MADTSSYLAAYARALRPEPLLTVSDWADKYRLLDQSASAEAGQWRTSRTPYLREIMDCLSVSDTVTQRVVLMKGAQVGAALPLDTPIPTPSGWTTMGQLEVGDDVFDRHGNPTRVVFASDTMVEHDCYRITFSDGATIVADAEHRWSVWDARDKRKVKTLKVVTTIDMLAEVTVRNGARNRWSIDVCEPLNYQRKDLPINPYTLGAWLGDGHHACNRITTHNDDAEAMVALIRAGGEYAEITNKHSKGNATEIVLKKPDHLCLRGHDKRATGLNTFGSCAECAREVSYVAQYPDGTARKRSQVMYVKFGARLKSLGVLGNKHIPDLYLQSDVEQRMELLKGLMDTDGHQTKNGMAEVVFRDKTLVDGVSELITSLGMKPVIRFKRGSLVNFGEYISKTAGCYSISFRPTDCVFGLSRKAARFRPLEKPTEVKRRRVVSIDKVDSVPVRCIQVDNSEHLYLAGRNMIPTHNTEAGNNWLGYIIHHAPAPTLYVMPTTEMIKRASKQRIAPLLESTPELRERIASPRSRDSGNTIMMKEFEGGVLVMTGANSAVGLRSMPARYLFMDEIDAYPGDLNGEGDPIALAMKRTSTFKRNRKIFMPSTPTLKDSSHVERFFLQSDQRYYYLPCPHCGHYQTITWAKITWKDGEPDTAQMCCESCGALIPEQHKTQMLERGEWRATATSSDQSLRGYHLSALYSPLGWYSWSDAVKEFLAAKDNRELFKTWVNTTLGEAWEESGDGVDPASLIGRCEQYDIDIPCAIKTAGVDVQKDRLECSIVAWGDGEECWLLDHIIIAGETASPDVWAELGDVLDDYSVDGAVVDAGYNTSMVESFVASRRWCAAGKGVSGTSRPLVEDNAKRKQRLRRRRGDTVPKEPIGVDQGKALLYARLQMQQHGPGYIHFRIDPAFDGEYFAQLTAERLTTTYRHGRPTRQWVATRPRNEALDCMVYAMAAHKLYTKSRRQTIQPRQAVAPPKPPTKSPIRSSYLL